MEYQYILTAVEEGVGTITINRPEITNKLNIACMYEICDAIGEMESNPETEVIILTAEGEYFCNGGELGDFRVKSTDEIRAFGDAFIALHTRIRSSSRIIIAMVQGKVLGGGFSLLEACDLAVASENAVFGVPEMSGGLAPMMCMVGLNRAVTHKRLKEMSFMAQPIDAQTALNWGIVNRLCPEAMLKEATKSFAREFVGLNPTAVAYTKLMFNSIDGLNYRGQMERGQDLLVGLLKSPNLKEVLDARDENREPSWK